MTNLQVFNNESNLELVIDNQTGESFASQSATARMCGRNESTIRDFITSRSMELKSAEVPTSTGLKTSRLLNEEQIMDCFIQYKPELLREFAKGGLRMYLHTLAGFEVTSTAVEPQLPKNYIEALKALVISEEEKEKAILLAATQQKQLEVQAPQVDAYKATVDANGCYPMETLCKMLQLIRFGKELGRNNMMKEFRAVGLLTSKNIPYQKHSHMFKVVQSVQGKGNNAFVTQSCQLKAEAVPELIKFLTNKGFIVSYISNEGGLVNV